MSEKRLLQTNARRAPPPPGVSERKMTLLSTMALLVLLATLVPLVPLVGMLLFHQVPLVPVSGVSEAQMELLPAESLPPPLELPHLPLLLLACFRGPSTTASPAVC